MSHMLLHHSTPLRHYYYYYYNFITPVISPNYHDSMKENTLAKWILLMLYKWKCHEIYQHVTRWCFGLQCILGPLACLPTAGPVQRFQRALIAFVTLSTCFLHWFNQHHHQLYMRCGTRGVSFGAISVPQHATLTLELHNKLPTPIYCDAWQR